MRSKLIVLLACLISLTLTTHAQSVTFPNEVEGFQFFKQDKLKKLEMMVSTQKEVVALFGEDCRFQCAYNDVWNIRFGYMTSGSKRRGVENGVRMIYTIKPENVGKLIVIHFLPRRPVILPLAHSNPKGMQCGTRTDVVVCMDNSKLVYQLYEQDDPAGKYKANQFVMITYETPGNRAVELYESVGEPVKP